MKPVLAGTPRKQGRELERLLTALIELAANPAGQVFLAYLHECQAGLDQALREAGPGEFGPVQGRAQLTAFLLDKFAQAPEALRQLRYPTPMPARPESPGGKPAS